MYAKHNLSYTTTIYSCRICVNIMPLVLWHLQYKPKIPPSPPTLNAGPTNIKKLKDRSTELNRTIELKFSFTKYACVCVSTCLLPAAVAAAVYRIYRSDAVVMVAAAIVVTGNCNI